MDRSDICYLVEETTTKDIYGVQRVTTKERAVYCHVDSVTRDEWYDGGRNGLNPEYRLTMFSYDYNGEKVLKYNDVLYTIYRTYKSLNDVIELYVERRKGANGA